MNYSLAALSPEVPLNIPLSVLESVLIVTLCLLVAFFVFVVVWAVKFSWTFRGIVESLSGVNKSIVTVENKVEDIKREAERDRAEDKTSRQNLWQALNNQGKDVHRILGFIEGFKANEKKP